MMAKNYYAILNISKNATDDQIKKAYRKLAIKYHPDKNKSAVAEERFKEIAEAYELLTDRRKRSIYDQFGVSDQNGDNVKDCRNPKGGIFTYHFHGDPRATFAQFFGAANPFGAFYTSKKPSRKFENSGSMNNEAYVKTTPVPPPSRAPSSSPSYRSTTPFTRTTTPTSTARSTTSSTPKRVPPVSPSMPKSKPQLKQDPPIEYDLFVTLEDIESGCMKKMRILRLVVDNDGQKRKEERVLNINVKPGWKEGTKITFPREGDRLPHMIPADIVFIIRDKPHLLFKREGSDIRYSAVVSLKRALCGTEIEVPTLQGGHLLINTHDEVIKPNTVKRFVGLGLPLPKEPQKRGDLLVDIVVRFPVTLEAKAKEKLTDALPD